MPIDDLARWLRELQRLKKHRPLERRKPDQYHGAGGIPVIRTPGNSAAVHTGSWRAFRPELHEEKCTKCGLCWAFCPEVAIAMKEKRFPKFDYNICKGCGICANACPVKAIEMRRDTHDDEKKQATRKKQTARSMVKHK